MEQQRHRKIKDHRLNDKDIGKSSTWRKTCLSATSAITKSTWIGQELNWSLCGDRLETLCLFFFKFVI